MMHDYRNGNMGTSCLKVSDAGDESAMAVADPTVVHLLSCNIYTLAAGSYDTGIPGQRHRIRVFSV